MAEMNGIWQKASEEMYKNAGAQGGQQGPFGGAGGPFGGQQGPQNPGNGGNGGKDDNVTDVDFEEVK